jgi:type I restriction enzyme, R subunit
MARSFLRKCGWFMMEWKKTPFAKILVESKDGEWGASDEVAGLQFAEVIRGTDFSNLNSPNIQLPGRWIKSHLVERKKLYPGDIILETAGGTAKQSTGRSAILRESFFDLHKEHPVLCAIFSRYLRIDKDSYSPEFIYYLLQTLYNDYYNVFRNMKKALSDYGQGGDGKKKALVQDKSELFRLLDEAIEQGLDFCREKGIDLPGLLEEPEVFKNIEAFKAYADILLGRDEWRKAFCVYDNTISTLYEASKPEILGRGQGPLVSAFQYLRGVVDSVIEQTDIDGACRKIAELLDESVVVDPFDGQPAKEPEPVYGIVQKGKTWDLSKIDFDKLKKKFPDAAYKNIEIADLRAFIERKLEQMMRRNVTRINFAQRFQEIIDRYNVGGSANENHYNDMLNFARGMRDEDERHVRLGLTEDELELFDLLKKEKMTRAETQKVKLAAKSLLHRLLEEHPRVLIQDWHKDAQTQTIVKFAVERVLHENLPESYDPVLFKKKCDNVYDVIFDSANKGEKWAA